MENSHKMRSFQRALEQKTNELFFKEGSIFESNNSQFREKARAVLSQSGEIFEEDKFRVLNRDMDSILIEKLGDDNNPYFVSAEFLKKVSEFIPDE